MSLLPDTHIVYRDALAGLAAELEPAAVARQSVQLAAVRVAVNCRTRLETGPVRIQHCACELRVGGELALQGVQWTTVEEVAAAALSRVHPRVVDCGVAAGLGTAGVQAAGQARQAGLVEEVRTLLPAVLCPDDHSPLHLIVVLAVVVRVVVPQRALAGHRCVAWRNIACVDSLVFV